MLRKPLNKIRNPFLKGPFTENPSFFKKLNRKATLLNTLSNKRGLTDKIRKIQKNIIKRESVSSFIKEKNTHRKQFTVEDSKQINNFIKPSFLNRFFLKFTKKNRCTVEKDKVAKYKYMFSLEQLKGEFYRKPSRHNKSSLFKILLEERKKCSIAYGCLNKKQMQKLFLQAKKFEGKFDENFVKIVESRLDVALFRICFFPTLFSARQWVNHGHILVNNSVINLPGYILKGGDIITVAPDKRDALKRKISLFIGEKIKIRACHYLVKIKTFYGIIKSCIPCQKINPLYLNPLFIVNRRDERFTLLKKAKRRILVYTSSLLYKSPFLKKSGQEQTRLKKSVLSFKKEGSAKSMRTLATHRKSVFRLPGNKGFQNIYGEKIKNLFYLLPKMFLFFSKKKEQLLPFLKVRNLFTSSRSLTQRVAAFKISGMKPLNLEVCYKNMVAIFLYSPQKVALPVSIDLHLIAKSIQ